MNVERLATSKLNRPAYRALVGGWPTHAGIACSGGTDSVAALLLAAAALRRGEIAPFIVMHVDHAVRPESVADVEFVAGLTADLQLPLVVSRIKSPPPAGTRAREADLREQRYAELGLTARRLGLRSVVTAHTRDDQVETVLLRLIQGAGPAAAAGMQPETTMIVHCERLRVVRPLLDVSRDQLVAVLAEVGVTPRHDKSNDDWGYRRNALRHSVIPRLANLAPGFDAALMRSVMLAARDGDYVDQVVAALLSNVITIREHGVAVDRQWLREAHPAIASRVVRAAAMRAIDGDARVLDFERTESVLRAAAGRTGAVIQLPHGVDARIERAFVVFEPRNREGS